MSNLNKFVFDFCKILERKKIKYVIVLRYIAIAFGRIRNT